MKVTRIITQELDLEITEATLLTIEEARKLPKRLRTYDGTNDEWWWLKSPGLCPNHVTFVDSDSFVNSFGDYAYVDNIVRPVLIISNFDSSNLQIGDTFEFGNEKFEVISNGKAFCLGYINYMEFRKDPDAPDANDYEKSDIKKYIDDWFEKVKETKG